MNNCTKLIEIFLCLIFAASAAAQSLVIRPYYGYFSPQLTNVNDQISSQIEGWQEILGDPIRPPGKIGGRALFGGQVQCHLNDDYFLALDFFRYEKNAATENLNNTSSIPYRFFFERNVKSSEIVLQLKYYFDYDSEGRLNKYLGFGPGLIFAKALSNTQLIFLNDTGNKEQQPVDTRGDFSKTAFTVTLLGGLDFRLVGPIAVWGEAGYQYAKIGQLQGSVRRSNDQQDAAFTTNTSFDFSGFYFRAGLGIELPFGE